MLHKRETFKDELLHHRDLRQKRDSRKKKEEIKLDAKIVKEASKALGNNLTGILDKNYCFLQTTKITSRLSFAIKESRMKRSTENTFASFVKMR